ncbi:hypothetical protein MCOR02_000061 [Pyricularia oryzae]|nr:hypothetical protein MCOR02_000061 [Pyricularia oryzae]
MLEVPFTQGPSRTCPKGLREPRPRGPLERPHQGRLQPRREGRPILAEVPKRWSLTPRTEKYRARLGSFARVANTVLLVVIAGLLAALLWRDGRSRASLQVGGDFGGAGPQFGTKITKWDADEAYVPKDPNEFFSKKTIDQWNTMMPAGNGWRQDENITFFTTSMTHQLHCVVGLSLLLRPSRCRSRNKRPRWFGIGHADAKTQLASSS